MTRWLWRGGLVVSLGVVLGCGFEEAERAERELLQREARESRAEESGAEERIEIRAQAVVGCRTQVKAPPPRTPAPRDEVKVLPPANGAYAGVYTAATPDDYRDFIAKTNDRPLLVFIFHEWVSDEEFYAPRPHLRTLAESMYDSPMTPLQFAKELAGRGAVLAVAWSFQCCAWDDPEFWKGKRKATVSLPRLLRGDFDGYIRKVARQIKAFGRPIMLAPFSEFNHQGSFAFGKSGTEYLTITDHLCRHYGDPGWPDGPERVRDALIHIIERFRREGVRNVTWFMYAGSHYMNPSDAGYTPWLHPKYFYPGDAYIDWVGQSTYFVDPRLRQRIKEKELNTPIATALEPGYNAWGSVTQRPLFLPEFGPLSDGSASRARILREVFTSYLPRMPRVKAFTLAHFDWAEKYYQVPRLGRFPDEIKAWGESVRDNPYYVRSLRLRKRSP